MGHQSTEGSFVGNWERVVAHQRNCDDDLGDEHPGTGCQQQHAVAQAIDEHNCYASREHVDYVDNHLG